MKSSANGPPRLGLYTSAIGWTFEDLRSVWLAAERTGFDSAQLMDNAVGPSARGDRTPVPEAYAALAALAEATETLWIGPLASPIGRRNPALLAKTAAFVDQISGGRLILTLGTGDDPLHFFPWGMDFPPTPIRMEMLEESLGIVEALWTRERVDFEGRHYQLRGAVAEPKPARSPRPPVWVGFTSSKRVMPRLVAEYCDGYNLFVAADETATAAIEAVRAACSRIGRDDAELTASRHVLVTLAADEFDLDAMYARQGAEMGRSGEQLRDDYEAYYCHVAGTPEFCAARLGALLEMGFDHLALQFQAPTDPMGGSPDSTIEAIELFATDVAPRLAVVPELVSKR
jgi:alkanesulfonate monooxygenase SsuD/methylene tetrahydromethanopterin reductase-like flavin-dependent oxidoreductase (luciferase family)